MFPDFIGIGAQKAGTTWLYQNLRAHPQVYMPRKELHYFNRKLEDGSGMFTRLFGKRETDGEWRRQVRNRTITHLTERRSLQDLLYDIRYYTGSYNDRWYASLFKPGRGKVKGEITPAYSVLGKEKVAHVHSIMPEAKLIFFMRNPIERVWSQLVMRFGIVEKGSAGLMSEDKLVRRAVRNSARLLTDYLRTLENWGTFYPEEQIFVGFLEDVSFFPGELLKSIYGFLGVDPFFEPPFLEKKIHSRSSGTMPTGLAVHLANEYREETGHLADLFGGYASFWYYCVRRLIEDPPQEEQIPYPLWASSLWGDWTGELPSDENPGLHSGPLSTVQVAK
jgi:hypothetical protein